MKTFANAEWQECGGSIEIPEGWFVSDVTLDTTTPRLTMTDPVTGEERTIPFPKPIAYFLSVHHCGSFEMRRKFIEDGKREVRNEIKSALGL